jgi:hypothetical protein
MKLLVVPSHFGLIVGGPARCLRQVSLTTDIYGQWERAERKIEAARMEGAFTV